MPAVFPASTQGDTPLFQEQLSEFSSEMLENTISEHETQKYGGTLQLDEHRQEGDQMWQSTRELVLCLPPVDDASKKVKIGYHLQTS